MNASAAIANVTTTTATSADLPRYGRDRPRLQLLVREETGSGYRAGDSSRRRPTPLADEPETVSDWGQVHARIVELAGARAVHERELCRWLLAAERLGVHGRAGYASLREYAGR
ncbi:MAG: hypothetical protein DRI90_06665, partial [Deltaproteobacteria bacterium]